MIYLSDVKRKKGETFESLLRRFNKRLIQSGKLLQARKNRFFTRGVSKNKRKFVALRKKQIGEKINYLKKIGEFKEDNTKKRKRG